jgi:hypothetical protein
VPKVFLKKRNSSSRSEMGHRSQRGKTASNFKPSSLFWAISVAHSHLGACPSTRQAWNSVHPHGNLIISIRQLSITQENKEKAFCLTSEFGLGGLTCTQRSLQFFTRFKCATATGTTDAESTSPRGGVKCVRHQGRIRLKKLRIL